jgi:hypothetical protein
MYEQLSKEADFCLYLAVILSPSSNLNIESAVRQAAGIALKAHIETYFAYIPP